MLKQINIKSQKGITLPALVIMIIILIIISGIAITGGMKLINKAKGESVITNMISIRAKTKIYMEEVNSKSWSLNAEGKANKRKEILEDTYKFIPTTIDEQIQNRLSEEIKENGYLCYNIPKETLTDMNLDQIYGYDNMETDSGYVAVINNDCSKVEIVYTNGIEYQDKTYYTLSEAQGYL